MKGLNEQYVKEASPIGVETAAAYFDATASIPSSSISPSKALTRQRSQTLPEHHDLGYFVSLEPQATIHGMHYSVLSSLLNRVESGLKSGVKPILADGALGGTYFLRDKNRSMCVVCKPGDEEPNAINNPYQSNQLQSGNLSTSEDSYKGNIVPGTGMYREVAAYVLDNGLAGIPATELGRVYHDSLHWRVRPSTACPGIESEEITWKTIQEKTRKLCSFQQYARHECSAEDMGSVKFSVEDVQRLAVLDIRTCNLDRHEGNILVAKSSPFASNTLLATSSVAIADAGLAECIIVTPITATNVTDLNGSFPFPASISTGVVMTSAEGTSFYSPKSSRARLIPQEKAAAAAMMIGDTGGYSSESFCASSAPAHSTLASHMLSFSTLSVNVSTDDTKDVIITQTSSISPNKPMSSLLSHKLIPIDHGFCFPHALHIDNANLAWMNWSQAKEPIIPELLRLIAGLDSKQDAIRIKEAVGDISIGEEYMLTMHATTLLLKVGAASGLTLYEIGTAMVVSCCDTTDSKISKRNVNDMDDTMCPLQSAIILAIQKVLEKCSEIVMPINAAINEDHLLFALHIDGGRVLEECIHQEVLLLVNKILTDKQSM